MNESNESIEELLSRRLDGDLTPEQRTRLARALADDAELAEQARRYDRLNRLLAGWRRVPVELDWAALSRAVSGGVDEARAERASEALDREIDPGATREEPAPVGWTTGPHLDRVARSYQATEDLLRDWAGPMPDVDWREYTTRVSNCIRREAAASSRAALFAHWRRRVAWFTPLAAAAAVALVAWWPNGKLSDPAGGGIPGPAAVLVALDIPSAQGRITIVFDESPAVAPASNEIEPGGAAIAIGPSWANLAETADEAYYD